VRHKPGDNLTLRKADWKPFMPTGVMTDANWWVDGHANKHRQQYLVRPPSAHITALDALKKPEQKMIDNRQKEIGDSQTKGKLEFFVSGPSCLTLFRTKLSIQPEREGK
jgi:hypothetical protein